MAYYPCKPANFQCKASQLSLPIKAFDGTEARQLGIYILRLIHSPYKEECSTLTTRISPYFFPSLARTMPERELQDELKEPCRINGNINLVLFCFKTPLNLLPHLANTPPVTKTPPTKIPLTKTPPPPKLSPFIRISTRLYRQGTTLSLFRGIAWAQAPRWPCCLLVPSANPQHEVDESGGWFV